MTFKEGGELLHPSDLAEKEDGGSKFRIAKPRPLDEELITSFTHIVIDVMRMVHSVFNHKNTRILCGIEGDGNTVVWQL